MHATAFFADRVKNTPVWVLTFAIFSLIYGFFGDPTPATFNVITLIWGGFFVFSLPWQNLSKLPSLSRNALFIAGVVSVGLFYPLIIGTLSGHDPFLILRDISAYLFIFIGFLFLYYFKENQSEATKVIVSGLLVIAFGMALRRLGIIPYGVERASVFEDPFALSVVPEILFGSVFLTSFAILNFLSFEKTLSKQILVFIILTLCALPLLAVMNMSVMRASLAMTFIGIFFSLLILILNRPLAGFSLIVLMAAVITTFIKPITTMFQLFWLKTVMMGTNNRLLEIETVLNAVLTDPFSFLFGKGWGAVLNNPAVGGEQVLYTHSLLSSSLLKGGFVLMSIVGIYIIWLFTGIFTKLFREKRAFPMALYLAIIPTFLINTLIYGGYKTIGFGLVLALAMGMVSCYGQYSRQT